MFPNPESNNGSPVGPISRGSNPLSAGQEHSLPKLDTPVTSTSHQSQFDPLHPPAKPHLHQAVVEYLLLVQKTILRGDLPDFQKSRECLETVRLFPVSQIERALAMIVRDRADLTGYIDLLKMEIPISSARTAVKSPTSHEEPKAESDFNQEIPFISTTTRITTRIIDGFLLRNIAKMSAKIAPTSLIPGAKGDKAFVLVTGGMDCTALLYLAKAKGLHVIGLEFENPARSAISRQRTDEIIKSANVPLCRIPLPMGEVVGLQADPSSISLRSSNSLFFSLAGNLANSLNVRHILGGYILSDWNSFKIPQTLPVYFAHLNALLQSEFGESGPRVAMPFIHLSKVEVLSIGLNAGAPLEKTWSCSKSELVACGCCEQCETRAEAFSIYKKSHR